MPDDNTATPPTTPPTTPEPPTEPAKYTDEWYDSVEKRFRDLGEFIKSGKANHEQPTQPPSAAASAQATAGQPPSNAAPTGADGSTATPARDTRPPKPSHLYFRTFGG